MPYYFGWVVDEKFRRVFKTWLCSGVDISGVVVAKVSPLKL